MLPIYEYNGTLAGNLLENTDVVNALTSSETTKPLSAAQGRVLKDLVGEEFEELWNGSASEWENTISLSKNIFQYKTLIFKVAPQKDNKIYLFSLKIPKNNILTSEDIRATIFYENCPGYLNISNYSTTSNLIKLVVQYFDYSKTISSICTVTKIWGIKR